MSLILSFMKKELQKLIPILVLMFEVNLVATNLILV